MRVRSGRERAFHTRPRHADLNRLFPIFLGTSPGLAPVCSGWFFVDGENLGDVPNPLFIPVAGLVFFEFRQTLIGYYNRCSPNLSSAGLRIMAVCHALRPAGRVAHRPERMAFLSATCAPSPSRSRPQAGRTARDASGCRCPRTVPPCPTSRGRDPPPSSARLSSWPPQPVGPSRARSRASACYRPPIQADRQAC